MLQKNNNSEISKIPKIITAAYNITGVVLSIAALIDDGIGAAILLLSYLLLGI